MIRQQTIRQRMETSVHNEPVAPTAARRLEIAHLSKSFDGEAMVNNGISLGVEPGEVFGLLGPNGAGKTTLVKQIIGLLRPDAGSITLGGYDLIADPGHARQLCSSLPQAAMPIDSFKIREAVDLAGQIRGGDRTSVRKRRQELFAALDLDEWSDTLGTNVSGGVRRLVGFVMTVVWPCPVVILDEPTNDVDPLRRRLLWEQIRRLGDTGTAVILVTHNVLEAERSVDRLAIIDGGKLVASGTPSSLKAGDRGRLRLHVMMTPGRPVPELPDFAESDTLVGHTLATVIDERRASDGIQWAQSLLDEGVAEEYALGATSLEDVYVRLTGHQGDSP
jgi:ABC-2 type transport system ATP-binding protein